MGVPSSSHFYQDKAVLRPSPSAPHQGLPTLVSGSYLRESFTVFLPLNFRYPRQDLCSWAGVIVFSYQLTPQDKPGKHPGSLQGALWEPTHPSVFTAERSWMSYLTQTISHWITHWIGFAKVGKKSGELEFFSANNLGNYDISSLLCFFLLLQTFSSWDFICSTHTCIQHICLEGSLKYFCLWYWWWVIFFLSCRSENIWSPFLTPVAICISSSYTLPKACPAAIAGYWPCGPAQRDCSYIPASSHQIFFWECMCQLSKCSHPVPVCCFACQKGLAWLSLVWIGISQHD